jgi:hypothetical protein
MEKSMVKLQEGNSKNSHVHDGSEKNGGKKNYVNPPPRPPVIPPPQKPQKK